MTDRAQSKDPRGGQESTDFGPDADLSTEAVFDSISAQAQETNLIRVDALDRLIQAGGAALIEDRGRAKDLAHQIAGSAGTFGYVRASEIAREIEAVLVGELDLGAVVTLQDRIIELREALS